jgi:uncharacterized protein YyaL (SSP411 family)
VLGADDGRWAADAFGVTEAGTFEEGASTLRLLTDPPDVDRLRSVRDRLLAARATRPQPARDDKIVTAWNGLAITALAEAGAAMRRPDWVLAASGAARFLLDTHLVDGRLRRTSRDGAVGSSAGVLEDYACLAEGLLALHQAASTGVWLDAAVELLDIAVARFADPEAPGAFFDTADDAERLVRRPGDPADNASPAGASALAGALLTASALVDADRSARYRDVVELAVSRAGLLIAKAPRFAGHWAAVAEAWLAGPVQVAIVADDPVVDQAAADLWSAAVAGVAGGAVVLLGRPDQDDAPLLAGRPLVNGGPAAYVCRGFVCDRPVTTVAELADALAR